MIQVFLKDNNFYSIQPNVFIKNITVKKWDQHVHVRIDFETERLERFDIHGTLRLSEDAKDLWKHSDSEAVRRAIWVYSDRTYRSQQALSWWTRNANVTLPDLMSICRDLSNQVDKWKAEFGRMGCEDLEQETGLPIDRMIAT